MTVHAPQPPSPQPSFVPVSPTSVWKARQGREASASCCCAVWRWI